jgi:hypothetical protein
MSEKKQGKPSWLERRREAKRRQREATGDSPQKQTQRPDAAPANAKENATRAGIGGFSSGGF